MITICFTYFRSLTLENLRAALWSVRQQDFSRVKEIVFLDNNTEDPFIDISWSIDELEFPVPVQVYSDRHGDLTRRQAWSTNANVRLAETPWVFYTRADYLLSFDIVKRFVDIMESKPDDWDGFIVSNGAFLQESAAQCERTNWRIEGPHVFNGITYDYTVVDSGVWMARRETFDRVGGFDERLSAWGHVQTVFQWNMHRAGVEFVRIPQVMHWHMGHGAERDIDIAHRDLAAIGGYDLKEMWRRYHGVSPYGA